MTEETQTQTGRIALGALSAVVIVLIGFFFLPAPDPEPEPAPAEVAAPLAPLEPVQTTPVATAPAIPEVAEAPAAPPEPQVAVGPQFDTFRVEPDGTMLIAGRTEPGQQVDVILAGKPIARVTADGAGTFVIFADAGPAEVPRRLSLLGDPEGAAIASETSYIVAPIRSLRVAEAPPAPPAPVAPPPAPDVIIAPSVEAPAPPPEPTVSAAVEVPAPVVEPPVPAGAEAPVPPTVLQADSEGITVVQTAPQLVSNVALDAITYDPSGEILLSGRATGDGAIRVYLDNRPITTSPVTAGGDWRTDLPDVDTGLYTLRIDEVDQEGTVVSRIETPFKREEAEDVAAVLAEETAREGFEVAVRTVQPGSTLWAIAEENLGKGIYYVAVFEANRDLIKDPDLIYPGQIFRIPEAPE